MKTIFLALGLFCSTQALAREAMDYVSQDEAIYKALRVSERLVSRGANSYHFVKVVGRLECIKTTTQERVVVGYSCELYDSQ